MAAHRQQIRSPGSAQAGVNSGKAGANSGEAGANSGEAGANPGEAGADSSEARPDSGNARPASDDPAVRSKVRVLGLGSPHADDRLGWQCADYLATVLPATVRTRSLAQPIRLLESLDGCRTLVLIDACRGGALRGTVCSLVWPDPRIARYRLTSSHQLGVAETLRLAESLGRLPPRVVLIGIEVGDVPRVGEQPGADALFERVIPDVERLVRSELDAD